MDYFDIIDDKSFCNMEEYKLFMEKFKPKVTTDECYTPKAIYNAVSDYVAEHYNLDNKNFVRPFYPGGNYQKENYRSGDVVVDNPPFSILAEILKFYNSHNIKFFFICRYSHSTATLQ